VKSLIHTIGCKFFDSLPTCLQTCSYKMYYVVHKFRNLSRATIHLGTHAHSVANEVYHTLITTISTIVLFASKTIFFCYLFNEDGKGHVEFIKVEKLHQMLLNFIPFCYLGIHNLIISLKHRLGNLGSIDYILKLKALFGYDYT
jgi:hypothetical protein